MNYALTGPRFVCLELSDVAWSGSNHLPSSLEIDIVLMDFVTKERERCHFDCFRSEKNLEIFLRVVGEVAVRRGWQLLGCDQGPKLLEELSVRLAFDEFNYILVRVPC